MCVEHIEKEHSTWPIDTTQTLATKIYRTFSAKSFNRLDDMLCLYPITKRIMALAKLNMEMEKR